MGRLRRRDDETRSESYGEILTRAGVPEIEGDGHPGRWTRRRQSAYAMHAHGAVFAEVTVDPDFGQVRVTRLVGAFAAGTVVNPRMVRSQYYGGMIWGRVVRAAGTRGDRQTHWPPPMNPNFADYHVPVERGRAEHRGDLGRGTRRPRQRRSASRVWGEIGVTGTAGAIANAVWHATGVRVRSFPITLDQLIDA